VGRIPPHPLCGAVFLELLNSSWTKTVRPFVGVRSQQRLFAALLLLILLRLPPTSAGSAKRLLFCLIVVLMGSNVLNGIKIVGAFFRLAND